MEFLGGNTQKDNVRAACKKCGYPGHLTFQCRNYLKIGANQQTVVTDKRSSSESPSELYYLTLQELRRQEEAREEKKRKKAVKKRRKVETQASKIEFG
ncbi:protein SREK1IP1-like [Culex quinquefasciatus]|uniref:protein SREK1IP1-like n=1 Tax=Culex quinquefasciatus TaxID=7176 RepID=UPI0018E29891|nr:protein SREK1IP1-like [Culex quinquefasciatus]